MKWMKRIGQLIKPRCGISLGEVSGPYEYLQLSKDGELALELPRSCVEFLGLTHYFDGANSTLWLAVEDRKALTTHEHCVTYGVGND